MERLAHYCSICGSTLIHKLHEGRQRPFCNECQHIIYFDPKVAVVSFILQADKLLMIQRAGDPGKGKWALPAGFVDHDEDPEDAAIRETLEETGFQIKIDKLLAVFPRRDSGLADIVIAYSGVITGGAMQADDDAADVGWFSSDNLPEMVFYPSITLTTQWRQGELDL